MASVNVNIRMDADLKKQFEAFCSEVGMNMTTAFTIFARRTVRENRIPFEVSANCGRSALSQVPPVPKEPEQKSDTLFQDMKNDFNI